MNKVDSVCKETLTIVDSIKDASQVGLADVLRGSGLDVEVSSMIINAVAAAIDTGYQRSYSAFRRSIENTLEGQAVEKASSKKK